MNKVLIMLFMMIYMLFSFNCFATVQTQDTTLMTDTVRTLAPDDTPFEKFSYIIIDANRPNLMLDSLIEKITVSDNNFVKWIDFANSVTKDKDLSIAQQKVIRPSWIVAVLIFILILLGIVKVFFSSVFATILGSFYNERVLAQINREDTVLTSWPYVFLYIIFSLSLGLFIVLNLVSIQGHSALTFINFLQSSLFVALLFVAKILLVRMLALIFEVHKIAKEYISELYLIYFNSALFLIPLLIIMAFSPVSYYKLALITFVVIVTMIFLFRFIRTGWSILGGHKFSIFYLILYLCAMEIAPILILVKTLK